MEPIEAESTSRLPTPSKFAAEICMLLGVPQPSNRTATWLLSDKPPPVHAINLLC